MPAVKKISREDILRAAFRILRKDGYEAVNARSIAGKLGCSTQPIYNAFSGMEELKTEMEQAAAAKHIAAVQRYMRKEEYTKYKAFGLGFVRFAKEEKQLFRYLYMTEHGTEHKPYTDVNISEILQTLSEEYGYSEDVARKFHTDMIYYSYGLALLVNVGTVNLTDAEISERLQTEFIALTKIYGNPPKMQKLPAEREEFA